MSAHPTTHQGTLQPAHGICPDEGCILCKIFLSREK